MHNNESDLKNMIDAMDSAMGSMKLAQQSIKSSITPEMMASLSPLGKKMINKAQELTNMDLKDPEKLLRQQKELTDLMAAAKREGDEALVKQQKQ